VDAVSGFNGEQLRTLFWGAVDAAIASNEQLHAFFWVAVDTVVGPEGGQLLRARFQRAADAPVTPQAHDDDMSSTPDPTSSHRPLTPNEELPHVLLIPPHCVPSFTNDNDPTSASSA